MRARKNSHEASRTFRTTARQSSADLFQTSWFWLRPRLWSLGCCGWNFQTERSLITRWDRNQGEGGGGRGVHAGARAVLYVFTVKTELASVRTWQMQREIRAHSWALLSCVSHITLCVCARVCECVCVCHGHIPTLMPIKLSSFTRLVKNPIA